MAKFEMKIEMEDSKLANLLITAMTSLSATIVGSTEEVKAEPLNLEKKSTVQSEEIKEETNTNLIENKEITPKLNGTENESLISNMEVVKSENPQNAFEEVE